MNEIIESFIRLQALESVTDPMSVSDAEIRKIRKKIPSPYLIHYDRLRARGKQGVAFVRRGVCGHCHMQVAIGFLALVRKMEGTHCCQNCGAYLAVVEEAPVPMPVRKTKPRRRVAPESTFKVASVDPVRPLVSHTT